MIFIRDIRCSNIFLRRKEIQQRVGWILALSCICRRSAQHATCRYFSMGITRSGQGVGRSDRSGLARLACDEHICLGIVLEACWRHAWSRTLESVKAAALIQKNFTDK